MIADLMKETVLPKMNARLVVHIQCDKMEFARKHARLISAILTCGTVLQKKMQLTAALKAVYTYRLTTSYVKYHATMKLVNGMGKIVTT